MFSPVKTLALKRPVRILLLQALIILALCLLLASFIQDTWVAQTNFLHAAVEIICIAIAFFTFLISWFTYETDPEVNHIIGFGFLVVGIFDSLHTYFFPSLNHFPSGYMDLSIRYWFISRLTEAVVLALSVFRVSRTRINKYLGLFYYLSIAFIVSGFVYLNPSVFPVLLTENGITGTKIALEYIVIFIYFLSLYKLYKLMNERDLQTYRYIFLALLIAIPSEYAFTIYNTITDYFSALGHLLKVFSYYYLFRGIWVSAVTSPQKIMLDILNEMPQGLFLFNSFNKVSFANKQAEELTGYTFEEIGGLPVEQMSEKISAQDLNQVMAQLKDFSSIHNQIISVSNPHSAKKLVTQGIRLEDGGTLLFFSDAKKVQELENMELQTRTVLHSIQTPMFLTDKNDVIIMCNTALANLTEMPEQEIIGFPCEEIYQKIQFFKEEDIFTGSEYAREGIVSEPGMVTDSFLASLLTRSNTKKELLMHTTAIHDIDGEHIGMLVIASDLTSLNQQRLKLQQQEKLAVLGEMAAGIVHEIRNPLTTIKGFSQILLERAENRRLREYAGLIVDTADEMNKVVSDFLAFAKPRTPLFQKVLLSSLINSLKTLIDGNSYVRGANFNIVPVLEEKAILADEDQLKQVLLNIIKNAFEAMQDVEEPVLTINAEYDRSLDEMAIKISDNGRGMSPEQITKVGTPFYTTKDSGTGLGLSICYQLIKEHKGRIEIKSKINRGTTFIISLPCLAEYPEELLTSL